MQVKSPDSNPEISIRSLRGLQWGLVLLGGGVAGAAYFFQFLDAERSIDRLGWFFLSLGVGLFLFGMVLDRLPASLALFIGSTLLSLLLGMGLLTSLHIHPFETLDRLLLSLFPPEVGIWRYDDRFGYNHRPGSIGRFQKGEIDVQYQIDPEGFRVTPDPKNPRGRVVFLGCSFTFGTGVEDDENYPFVLGQDYWTEFKIINRGLTGWGTAHAYLSLLEELQKETPPSMIFYAWITGHRQRNYIRKSWVEHIGRRWGLTRNLLGVSDFRKHPHFEIDDGELVFRGVVGPGDVHRDPRDLKEKETSLTLKFIEEMNRFSRERGIPFYLLMLPEAPAQNPLAESGMIEPTGYLLEMMEQENIPYFDLQETHRGSLPNDNHPNAETHRAIAQALAENPEIHRCLYPGAEESESQTP